MEKKKELISKHLLNLLERESKHMDILKIKLTLSGTDNDTCDDITVCAELSTWLLWEVNR